MRSSPCTVLSGEWGPDATSQQFHSDLFDSCLPSAPQSVPINRAFMLSHFSYGRLFVTPWTVAHQTPLSMGILQTRILEWVACPPPGDLPKSGIWPMSLKSSALADGSLPLEPLQFSHSVVSDFCNPMDCSTPGFPVHHQFPELA